MKVVIMLVCLVAVASAGFVPHFPFPPSSATGSAGATTGHGSSPFGQISSTSAQAGGASESGGTSINNAHASQQSAQTPFGNFHNANTGANSNQSSG